MNTQNPNHDFNAPIEKTSVALAKVILQNYIENFDTFVYENIDSTTEEGKAQDNIITEKSTDFAIKVMSLMSTTDIPADYATLGIDKIIAGLMGLKSYIEGSVRQFENEILSRSYGAKSPVTNTYAKDVATFGEVMLALNKIREATGNKPEDYFIPKKEELSTGEDKPEVVAPSENQ